MYQTLNQTKVPFLPTNDEKMIYWTNENGNNAMRYNNFVHAKLYTNDIIDIA